MDINKNLKETVDKINFLRGLIRIAKSDGVKEDSEFIFYYQAAQALNLSEEELNHLNDAWNNDDIHLTLEFSNNASKMFFFVQAIQLCWVDGSYMDAEKKEIRLIAQEIGISEDAIERVEAWVEEGMEWHNRGAELLKLS